MTNFINSLIKPAQKNWENSGVLPSITIAQAILESGWGESHLSRYANNLFGIKAHGNPNYVILPTIEYVNGVPQMQYDKFRKYDSIADSLTDHANFLNKNSRYKNIIGKTDYKYVADELQRVGYATDTNYASKLKEIIEQEELYKYDKITSVPIISDGISNQVGQVVAKPSIINGLENGIKNFSVYVFISLLLVFSIYMIFRKE